MNRRSEVPVQIKGLHRYQVGTSHMEPHALEITLNLFQY